MTDIEIRENGASVSVRQGDRIIVRIPENATTGYRWTPGSLAEHLELESDDFVPPAPLRPGAGGERVIALRAKHPGSGQTEFVLRRPWETGEPVDRWHVAVTVA